MVVSLGDFLDVTSTRQPRDPAGQASGCLAQWPKLFVYLSECACLQIVVQAAADLFRPTQPEALLERAVVGGTAGAEHAPEADPELINGALEVRHRVPGHIASGYTGLDGLEEGVERGDLIGEGC